VWWSRKERTTDPHCGDDGGTGDALTCGASISHNMCHPAGRVSSVSQQNPEPTAQTAGNGNPHCGEIAAADEPPHCGEYDTHNECPPCGETQLQRAASALDALEQCWGQTASKAWNRKSSRELAIEFRRALQAQPDLVGRRVRSWWIEARYPIFCQSLGLRWWPPYRDFAKELPPLMPKKRQEDWRNGRRVGTFTAYLIPDPAAAVALADERKRA
jgi:hypothetical protein